MIVGYSLVANVTTDGRLEPWVRVTLTSLPTIDDASEAMREARKRYDADPTVANGHALVEAEDAYDAAEERHLIEQHLRFGR